MKLIESPVSDQRKIRSNSVPLHDGCRDRIIIRIYDSCQSFEILKISDINNFDDMQCINGNMSSSYESLPKQFRRKSFLRRSFNLVRTNFARRSERFIVKYSKDKWKTNRDTNNNNDGLRRKVSTKHTYDERNLPSSMVYDIDEKTR